jgi:hypothetical protein
MSRNPHDGERVHSGFSKSCQHCMAERVHYKVAGEDGHSFAVNLRGAHVTVKVIQGCDEVAPAEFVRKDVGSGLFLAL